MITKQNLYTVVYDSQCTIGTISVVANTDGSIGFSFRFLPIEGKKLMSEDLRSLMSEIKETYPGCEFTIWLTV